MIQSTFCNVGFTIRQRINNKLSSSTTLRCWNAALTQYYKNQPSNSRPTVDYLLLFESIKSFCSKNACGLHSEYLMIVPTRYYGLFKETVKREKSTADSSTSLILIQGL